MSNEEAIEEFDFFNEGDYITREMSKAKDIVLKKLQETEADLYEANNRIVDLMRIIDEKEEAIIEIKSICINNKPHTAQQKIIKYIEERCK